MRYHFKAAKTTNIVSSIKTNYTNLNTALDQVKGDDSGVGDTAREDTAETAQGVEFGRAEFNRSI